MGFFTNKIANETVSPAVVSLASNPNYIEFESLEYEHVERQIAVTLRVRNEGFDDELLYYNNYSDFQIEEVQTGRIHYFKGRTAKDPVFPEEYNVFDLTGKEASTALNIQKCLSEHPFFKDKFEVTISSDNPTIINIVSLGYNNDYTFRFIIKKPTFHEYFIIKEGNSETVYPAYKEVNVSMEVLTVDVAENQSVISIIESDTNEEHTFTGTKDKTQINDTTYLITEDRATTAENIASCLMKDDFFRNKFNITIPFVEDGDVVINGSVINLVSKGIGGEYTFRLNKNKPLNPLFIRLTGDPTDSSNYDSINGDNADCEIRLDLYRNDAYFLGREDKTLLGDYITTLTKAYYGEPVWFNVNAMMSNQKKMSNSFLDGNGWHDAGTMSNLRFVAKRYDGATQDTFYISDVLYTLNGYDRGLEANDVTDYVYDATQNNVIKPLTRQPALFHIKGQSQYLNFVLSDKYHGEELSGEAEFDISIAYKLYTQSERLIAKVEDEVSKQSRDKFHMVNTIRLDIDEVIEDYDNIGRVEIYLARDGERISESLVYRILPECLYKVNDFAFLNSLGGWSSFNFSGTGKEDFKASANTIYKTQTPGYDVSDEIESVYNKEVTEKYSIETMPVSSAVAEWLKELSASPAVYELSTKRYVVVDELNIKPNSKDDLFRLEMKYHYSDSYNASVK